MGDGITSEEHRAGCAEDRPGCGDLEQLHLPVKNQVAGSPGDGIMGAWGTQEGACAMIMPVPGFHLHQLQQQPSVALRSMEQQQCQQDPHRASPRCNGGRSEGKAVDLLPSNAAVTAAVSPATAAMQIAVDELMWPTTPDWVQQSSRGFEQLPARLPLGTDALPADITRSELPLEAPGLHLTPQGIQLTAGRGIRPADMRSWVAGGIERGGDGSSANPASPITPDCNMTPWEDGGTKDGRAQGARTTRANAGVVRPLVLPRSLKERGRRHRIKNNLRRLRQAIPAHVFSGAKRAAPGSSNGEHHVQPSSPSHIAPEASPSTAALLPGDPWASGASRFDQAALLQSAVDFIQQLEAEKTRLTSLLLTDTVPRAR
eukprot:TRINITY_DN4624_c0_g3_i1.p1 TRINITY_DN4624_c0_g3~~TRINITY_DN4624_c0_g3_i1.p1  ORF type:complete len:408 (+),score=15.12 TRINITY_DN4624_c0_g3_i1:106-1224(+)